MTAPRDETTLQEISPGTVGTGTYMVTNIALVFLCAFLMVDVMRLAGGATTWAALFPKILLVIATFGLVQVERFLRKLMRTQGLKFYSEALKDHSADEIQAAYEHYFTGIWRTGPKLVGAAAYSILICTLAANIHIHAHWTVDKTLLIGMLVCVNVPTGSILASLFAFGRASPSLAQLMRVDLMQLRNPTTQHVLDVTRWIALAGAPYVALCITATMLLPLKVDQLIWVYVGFSVLAFMLAALLPNLYLINRASQQKADAISVVNVAIERELAEVSKTGNSAGKPSDMKTLEQLINLRLYLGEMDVLPFKSKLVVSMAAIIITAFFPVIGQYLFEWLVLE